MEHVHDTGIAFSRPTLVIGAVVLFLWMASLPLGLLAICIADEYVKPAFSEQSVPQPRLY
jgi:hypothetical protein